MYRDMSYSEFMKYRDMVYEPEKNSEDHWSYSWKAYTFRNEEEAKWYIEACRDEEGVHYGWPEVMPIYQEAGPSEPLGAQ